ncbi:6168_t:CDS:2, partial [Entrophospora sp. SA101]
MYHIRQLIATSMMTIWSIRLATFLFYRVMKAGNDSRFSKVKINPRIFLVFWIGQAAWIFTTGLGVYLVNSIPKEFQENLNITDYIGIIMWVIGITFEIIADYQKFSFRSVPENKEKFIQHGLWKYWFGVTILCTPTLIYVSNIQPELIKPYFAYFIWATPLFPAYLITKVSGIPPLERGNDKKFGNIKAYK